MLAGDLAGIHQANVTLPAGINLIQNGDFETFTAGSDNLYAGSEVDNWNYLCRCRKSGN